MWKSAEHAQEAAEAMGITADRLLELDLIDHLIIAPPGGAHRHMKDAAAILKHALVEQLDELIGKNVDQLLQTRYEKFRTIGQNL